MCYDPILVSVGRYKRTYSVPCGSCVACLQDYQNSIKIRILSEFEKYKNIGVFFTLTYGRSSVPVSFALDQDTGEISDYDEYSDLSPLGIKRDRNRILNLCVKDVQSWIKRGRQRMFRYYGYYKDYSYYITSEYGPRSLRPHYHGVFIGLTDEDFRRFFFNDWHSSFILNKRGFPVANKYFKGNVKFENIVYNSKKSPGACATYISKYCSKGVFENPRVKRGYVLKPFHLLSKKFGLCWVDSHKESILQGYEDSFFTYPEHQSPLKLYKPYDERKDIYFGLLNNFNSQFFDGSTSVYDSSIQHPSERWILPRFEVVLEHYCIRSWPSVKRSNFFNIRKDGSFGRCTLKLYLLPNIRHWYNKIYCLVPRLEFVKSVVSRLKVPIFNDKDNTVYNYKLPRYYYEKLFPKDSPIRRAISEVLQIFRDEICLRKLAKIQTERSSLAFAEVYHTYLLQEQSEIAFQKRTRLERLKRFYEQSKF